MAALAAGSRSSKFLLRKGFVAMVTSAAGIALLSCSATQPSADNVSSTGSTIEPSAPIVRAPLAAPMGYASPSPHANSQKLPPPHASPYAGPDPDAASVGAWRASPRWAAVRGDGCVVVHQESNAADRPKFRVANCSEEQDAPTHLQSQ